YAHVRRFLAPKGMFGQWLHLSEINDGLVLSVVRAVAENFPAYTIYSVGNRDILIVATNDSTIAPPDWSVFQLPPVAEALRRVYPLTVPILDALHMVDAATLAPLVSGGGGNSDFYPSLDLGAERTRYLNEGATGFVGLTSDRFGIAPILEGRRTGVTGERYTPITFVPRLEAMELAARARDNHYAGASQQMLGAAERARAVDRMLASNVPPFDWHEWASAVRDADELHGGGTSGVADTALYAAAQRYLDTQKAPAEARAAIAFLHGLASWDFAEVSSAADVLIPAAERDDLWMPVDLLREGTAVARIKLGDPVGARFALDHLASRKQRDINDVRPQLLDAWVNAAAALKRPTAEPQR
ncbi:MAG: hypothetical protein ABI664_21075, partial [bacterium]